MKSILKSILAIVCFFIIVSEATEGGFFDANFLIFILVKVSALVIFFLDLKSLNLLQTPDCDE